MSVQLAHPWALLLLLAVPAWWYWRRGRRDAVRFARLPRGAGRRGVWLARLPAMLRSAAWALLVVALARPFTVRWERERSDAGIAIMVALDVSSSMLAEDFEPRNRLEVAKQTTLRFVAGRSRDRIGLVAFAGEALTQVPTTADHAVLAAALRNLRAGALQDGTAIGLGLATAANRLRRLPEASRVVVLLSDGENNRGAVDPRDAARAAAAFGIRVYTVGVGSDTRARIPVAVGPEGIRYATLPVSLDEPLLTDLAAITGGRYFRATDADALRRVFAEVDRLERSPVRGRPRPRRRELFLPLVLLAAALLLAEWALRGSRWGAVP